MLAAFILFRILDVWKPIGIRSPSHLPGGWGVVVDDIAAGFAANLILQVGVSAFFIWDAFIKPRIRSSH